MKIILYKLNVKNKSRPIFDNKKIKYSDGIDAESCLVDSLNCKNKIGNFMAAIKAYISIS